MTPTWSGSQLPGHIPPLFQHPFQILGTVWACDQGPIGTETCLWWLCPPPPPPKSSIDWEGVGGFGAFFFLPTCSFALKIKHWCSYSIQPALGARRLIAKASCQWRGWGGQGILGRALWKAPLPGAWGNEFYFQESHLSSPLTPDGISPTPSPPSKIKQR